MSRAGGLVMLVLGIGLNVAGCTSVTTKITGSSRAGAEQLLLTGTLERAVSSIDFRPLQGRRVYLDSSLVSGTDSSWVTFCLRREMARQGLTLVSEKKEAQAVVEASVAAYGTDEVDCRVALPNTFATGALPLPIGSSDSSGLIRKSRQDAVVKLALIGLDTSTHQVIWETPEVTEFGFLDRRFFGTTNLTRRSSEPELEHYPRRRLD